MGIDEGFSDQVPSGIEFDISCAWDVFADLQNSTLRNGYIESVIWFMT